MDGIIINELSLNGQFLDSRDFWKNGMPPFHKALQDALSHGVGYLFKQGSFFAAQATPDKTLHDLLTAPDYTRLYLGMSEVEKITDCNVLFKLGKIDF